MIVVAGQGATHNDGNEQKREAFDTVRRFRANGKAYFEFLTTPGAGPTNNFTEQAVRFVVMDRLFFAP